MNSIQIFFLLVLVGYIDCEDNQFEWPNVTLTAYDPAGFKASMKAQPGIELFAFHGKLNEPIQLIEPGQFSEDIRRPDNKGFFTYFNPDLKLKIGDIVNYWMFVQHGQYGYRKDAQMWTVKGKQESTPGTTNNFLLKDKFNKDTINDDIWIKEQFIPAFPDHEFVVYKKDEDVSFLKDNRLVIKPKLITEEAELRKEILDLRDGCTRSGNECRREKFIMQNPIVSGRLVSKVKFSNNIDVEIKAKLPSGDWMYPELYLEDDTNKKLVIAYSRGNKHLIGDDGVDIGGSLLFGGPILDSREPARSEKLSSYRSSEGPFSDVFHVYRLKWTQDRVELYVDGRNYGITNMESIHNSGFGGPTPNEVRLVLGVGVGGISDFPDGYKSGEYLKPWKNGNRLQVKKFYESKDKWHQTWNENGQLEVEYVKIKSL